MRQRGTVFFLLIALALAALAALVFLLGPGARPETPAVILAPPPASDSGGESQSPRASDSPVLEIGVDSVQTVLATLDRAESYSRSLTAVSLWDGGRATTELNVWVHGADTRIALRGDADEAVKNVLLRGDETWIWYSDRPGVWHGRAGADDADAYQTLLTYENVLSLDRSAILDAGYDEFGGEICIYLRYIEGALGYESLCHVSVATGLLMGVETYDGEALVYTLSSTPPVLSIPDESVFALP